MSTLEQQIFQAVLASLGLAPTGAGDSLTNATGPAASASIMDTRLHVTTEGLTTQAPPASGSADNA